MTSSGRQLRFASVGDVIRRLDPSYPVFCIFPDLLKERARTFVEGFPGTVLYAVKCNPHPYVLKALNEGGIEHFDTASISEIAKVTEQLPEAHCYFNHPVKGRGALEAAADVYGIKDYVVDHPDELEKLVAIAGTDITVEVRIATPKGKAVYDLSAKFGAAPDDAAELLKRAQGHGCRTALAFHVGSQCLDPAAFRVAMEMARKVADKAGVALEYLDVGGGFPASYKQDVPPLQSYFDTIADAKEKLWAGMPLLGEPGRALVAEGCSVLTQVHLRKGDDLYINDGIYGCLSEIRDGDLDPPVRAIRKQGNVEGPLRPFRVFGPTCDSLDVLKLPFYLPENIREGDWIEFGLMGAYSIGMQTGFNGFITDTIVRIDGMHEEFVS
ncbi:type III PLP-dependent enzyme [Parvibaculum sp.]|jgi:ornithine decarboxylase|uniref:type III PLP-dependent enzyme n=1 Tax=Parvibaculum sp. TaxID=2024848 RepID=UPI000C43882D|nr:type III PLP-dependent enzyme [Parvibaculum sp.]MAV92317.1 ornithine decarboxylase [Pseudobdellovibrionaceae bacterium]HAC56965.1 type III PLP-dependent enzyme [Rhodobiaceae bacterium]MAU60512.1 ornithine decarboxylase [Parvibaculum sp.]MBO6669344.1 type III PLP-dependent enzyme [Parvibaculum sp.]MBO6692739.1 type III PLP-dependent enzyme [Parvibaculum sp.]|tara:strand:+ start:222 stop:1370 length:1149 start_codon:yes stop_codon:yes gene_type:complete